MAFPTYDSIKKFYDNKNWTLDQVQTAVTLNRLTADQYKTITGQDYVDPNASTAPAESQTPASDTSTAPASSADTAESASTSVSQSATTATSETATN